MPGTAKITTRLKLRTPAMNGKSTPIARERFWMGRMIVTMRRNQPAPATCAASSGSGPSCIIDEMPAREANGICSAIDQHQYGGRAVERGMGPRGTANSDR